MLHLQQASQCINHITSFPHYPKSNGFIERQIKTIKTALDKAKSSLDDLLLSLRFTLIGSHHSSPREILHNRPQLIDFEEVRDNLIAQKLVQKKHHDHRHNTGDLSKLHTGQPVLFLSPADANSYIEGNITGPAHNTQKLHVRSTRQSLLPQQSIHAPHTH